MIGNKAVLVRLEMGGYTGRQASRRLSRETAEAHGAESNTLTATLRVVPPQALKRVEACSRACREYFDSRTLPWERRGASLLPTAIYWEFTERLSALLDRRTQAVDDFCSEYSASIDDWVARLNGMSVGLRIPDVADVRAAFAHTTSINPVPVGADFRVDVGEEETARIRAAADAAAAERVQAGVMDAVARLREVVERYRDNLRSKVNADGEERKGRVTASLGRDLADLLSVVGAFNLTGDAALTRIIEDCRASLPTDTRAVAESDTERARVQAEAERIADQMRELWGA